MIKNLDVTVKQARLDVIDNLVYSHAEAPVKGTKIDLKMVIIKDSLKGNGGVWQTGKKPCILWIMGGAWLECPYVKNLPFLTYFARHGYVVASARIRLSLEAQWPAQMIDIKTAIRYLRAHADEHGIDTDHIAIMGWSSGGHLTAVTAMNSGEYISGEWKDFSSDVQCAVDLFGPVDLFTIKEQRKENGFSYDDPADAVDSTSLTPEEILIGGKIEKHLEAAKDVSPISHISERACPILILHGDKDPLIPYQQSIQLHDALNEAGKPTDLYILNEAEHGDYRFCQEDAQQIMLDFLDKHLK